MTTVRLLSPNERNRPKVPERERKLLYKYLHQQTRCEKSTNLTERFSKQQISKDQNYIDEKPCTKSSQQTSLDPKMSCHQLDQNGVIREINKESNRNEKLLKEKIIGSEETNSCQEYLLKSLQNALMHSNDKNDDLDSCSLSFISHSLSTELIRNMNSNASKKSVWLSDSGHANNQSNFEINLSKVNNVINSNRCNDESDSESTADTSSSEKVDAADENKKEQTTDIVKNKKKRAIESKTRSRTSSDPSLHSTADLTSIKGLTVSGYNRVLHSPILVDSEGLPIPPTRPRMESIPRCKASSERRVCCRCCCCCCVPNVRSMTKKAEKLEKNIGSNLKEDTKSVLKEINQYRKSMRSALTDLSEVLFEFNKKTIDQKSETLNNESVHQLGDFLLKTVKKLKVDIDWLERLTKDLRKAEKTPLTLFGIFHHLVHNGAILSMESEKLLRKFENGNQKMDFSAHVEKLVVELNKCVCNGSGVFSFKNQTLEKISTIPSLNNNVNNNNGSSNSSLENSISELEILEMIVRKLFFILQHPVFFKFVLTRVNMGKLPEFLDFQKQYTNSSLEKGDGFTQSSQDKMKTIITSMTDPTETVVPKMMETKQKSLKLREPHSISCLPKLTKKNFRPSNQTSDDKKSQRKSVFHSCADNASFCTTLFNIESISSEESQFQSISTRRMKNGTSETIVNETSPMFTAAESVKPSNWSDNNQRNKNIMIMQDVNEADKEFSLKPKLVEVIHKINQLARANNRVVKRIRSLERFVGKKSTKHNKRSMEKQQT